MYSLAIRILDPLFYSVNEFFNFPPPLPPGQEIQPKPSHEVILAVRVATYTRALVHLNQIVLTLINLKNTDMHRG
jgi:hypothetical protein